MRVRIHRGSSEIGGSCVELHAGGESLVLDAGMPLTLRDGEIPFAPKINAERLRAIVISHGHLDHYGLLPSLPNVPIVMGEVARRIVEVASPFMTTRMPRLSGPNLVNRKTLEIGPFRITPYLELIRK